MPRTKRPVQQQEKPSERNDAIKFLDKIRNEQKKQLDARVQMECRDIEVRFKILLGSFPKDMLNKSIGQMKAEIYLPEVLDTVSKHNSTRSASHDDGYLTENSSQCSNGRGETIRRFERAPASASSRRSRSAGARRAAPPTPAPAALRRRSRSAYKTPMYNKSAATRYPLITPKVAPQTALTLLRQPRVGEMVVSMDGSPVTVPTCCTMQQEEKANCNILLQDGTMLSLQPKQLRQSQAFIPYSLMDSNMLGQLKILKENLDVIVRLGENGRENH